MSECRSQCGQPEMSPVELILAAVGMEEKRLTEFTIHWTAETGLRVTATELIEDDLKPKRFKPLDGMQTKSGG